MIAKRNSTSSSSIEAHMDIVLYSQMEPRSLSTMSLKICKRPSSWSLPACWNRQQRNHYKFYNVILDVITQSTAFATIFLQKYQSMISAKIYAENKNKDKTVGHLDENATLIAGKPAWPLRQTIWTVYVDLNQGEPGRVYVLNATIKYNTALSGNQESL